MSVEKIEKLEDLLPLDEGEEIVSHEIKRLTAPGENYGSLMLSVDITVQDQDGKTGQINAVAKMVPPNEAIQAIFNTQVTFRNEIGFYKNVVPILQNFQREHGVEQVIDFFPKFLGGRINLKGDADSEVDSDAVLLLENLKTSNFINVERTEGFDLNASELIVKDLAYLHGVTLALKIQKPEVFENEVKPLLKSMEFKEDENRTMALRNNLKKILESTDGCRPFVSRVLKLLDNPPKFESREPFATISHNDVWVNNIMTKLDRGKSIENKFVDFQMCDYGSPAKDLVFFLFTSVQNHILEKKYDYLVQLYHQTFVRVLKELNCDATPFSFKEFEKEIEREVSNGQLGHIIFMFFPIFAPKGDIEDISEFDPETLMTRDATDLHRQKLAFVIKEFIKRDWI